MSDLKIAAAIVAAGSLAWFLLKTERGARILAAAGFAPAAPLEAPAIAAPVSNSGAPSDYNGTVTPSGDATGGIIGSCGTCQDQSWSIAFGSAEQQAAAYAPILAAQVVPLDYLPPSYPRSSLKVYRVPRFGGMVPQFTGDMVPAMGSF